MAKRKSDGTTLTDLRGKIQGIFKSAYEEEIWERLTKEKACEDVKWTYNLGRSSGVLEYTYDELPHTYEIRPVETAEGFEVETLFDGIVRVTEPLKDISKWTKEKVYNDFFKGYEKWGSRKRTDAEIQADRSREAKKMRRPREIG